MPTAAEHLNNMAWECRALTQATYSEALRRDLILIAERFERAQFIVFIFEDGCSSSVNSSASCA